MLKKKAVCPECRASYGTENLEVGQRIKCKQCGAIVDVVEVEENGVEEKKEVTPVVAPSPRRKSRTPVDKSLISAKNGRILFFIGFIILLIFFFLHGLKTYGLMETQSEVTLKRLEFKIENEPKKPLKPVSPFKPQKPSIYRYTKRDKDPEYKSALKEYNEDMKTYEEQKKEYEKDLKKYNKKMKKHRKYEWKYRKKLAKYEHDKLDPLEDECKRDFYGSWSTFYFYFLCELIGSLILLGGLAILVFKGDKSERLLALIMIAIMVFAIFSQVSDIGSYLSLMNKLLQRS